MIYIESIKCKEVRGRELRLPHFGMSPGEGKGLSVQTEVLHGESFMSADGTKKTICMAKEVQEVLGLPMAAFNSMNKTIIAMQRNESRLISEVNGYRANLNDLTEKVDNLTWWGRLSFLFSGVMPCGKP